MNPLALLGALAWAASLAAAGWWAYGAGSDHEIARLAREDDIEVRATTAAADAAASAIARMEIKHVTVRQQLETQVREVPVFRDCRSGPEPVRLLNDTIGAVPAASAPRASELLGPGTAR